MNLSSHALLRRIEVGALLILFSLAFGCRDKRSGDKPRSDEIVVGSLLALSGPDQSFGITQRRGMELALEEVNQAGGVNGHPLRVLYADTRLEEELGLQEYNRLVRERNVQVIVGVTGSGVALRLAPRANHDKVVLLDSIDTSPRLTTEGGDYFFRNIASDSYSGVILAKWALAQGHSKAVLIYNSEVPWATGCRSAVEEAYRREGGQVVLDPIAVVESTDNFAGPIASIRRAAEGAQAVFVCLMGRQGGLFVSQGTANNLKVTFYGTDPFSQQEFIDNAGKDADGVFFVLPGEGKNERYEQFKRKYRERHGADPDTVAAKAYDSVHLLALALGSVTRDGGEVTGERVRGALLQASFDGATGPNAFDENGDLREALFDRYTYRQGQRTLIQ